MANDTRTPKRKISLVTIIVPAGIVIVSLFPLRPLVQQGLVGIALIWFYLEIALGFSIR